MNDLVVTMAFGPEYNMMLDVMEGSLRTRGDFYDDIIALSDLQNHDSFRHWTPRPNMTIMAYNAYLSHHVDFEAYDRWLFIECDSVVRQPIHLLFDCLWPRKITVCAAASTKMDDPFVSGMLSDYEREEMRKVGMPAINDGVFGGYGADAREFFRDWEGLTTKRERESDEIGPEQTALNYMVCRDGMGARFNLFPRGYIDFPNASWHPDMPVLSHFAGATGNNRLVEMKEMAR